MKRLFIASLVLMLIGTPAGAERLMQALSSQQVQITSSFDGATLSLFGTIDPDPDGTPPDSEGTYNIIVTITGPLQDRVTRMKTNRFGIWSNTDQVTFRDFPSFYAVMSSGRPPNIATEALLETDAILPEQQARRAAESSGLRAERFGGEMVRLMTEEGHFVANDNGVRFLSRTSFMVQVNLPSDVANGPFLARTYVLKDKVVVAEGTQGFSVRKTGFENFVYVASRQQPLLYGLVCIALALGTGWLAGVAFRR